MELSSVSSCKDTNPMGLGASLMTSFNPDHLHEDPSLNIVTLGIEASTNEFEEIQFSPQHTDRQLVTIRSLLCTRHWASRNYPSC